MKEGMLEVLIYLFENYIFDGDSFEPDQEELARELVGAGFDDVEVNKAFVWLEGLLDACERDANSKVWQAQAASSIRFYTHQESQRLKFQGRSLLIRLESVGLLDQRSRETVIERVMALDSPEVTVDHIKWVVLMVIGKQPDYAEMADWANVVVSEDLLHEIH